MTKPPSRLFETPTSFNTSNIFELRLETERLASMVSFCHLISDANIEKKETNWMKKVDVSYWYLDEKPV